MLGLLEVDVGRDSGLLLAAGICKTILWILAGRPAPVWSLDKACLVAVNGGLCLFDRVPFGELGLECCLDADGSSSDTGRGGTAGLVAPKQNHLIIKHLSNI